MSTCPLAAFSQKKTGPAQAQFSATRPWPRSGPGPGFSSPALAQAQAEARPWAVWPPLDTLSHSGLSGVISFFLNTLPCWEKKRDDVKSI